MLWSPNTQLHYPFQNTALDYSGNARHGTINGSGVFATKPNGSRCLYFDGVGDYVATPSFGLTGTVVVFAAWVRCNPHTSSQNFIGDDEAHVAPGFIHSMRDRTGLTGYALIWYYASGAVSQAEATGFFTGYDDVWLHMVVVCDYAGKNVYFYRNAVLFATVAMVGTPLFPSTDRVKYIGSYNTTTNLLTDGYLQNVYLGTLATMPAAGQMLANVNRLMLGMNPIW